MFHWKLIDCVMNQVNVFRDIKKSIEIARDSYKSGFDMSGLVPGIDPTADPIFRLCWG